MARSFVLLAVLVAVAVGSSRAADGRELIALANPGVSVIDADGRPVAEFDVVGCPAWSPDGRRVAAHHTAIDEEGVYVIDLATRSTRRISRIAGYNLGRPSWSRDGRELAYNGDGGRLVVARADGRGSRLLTKPPSPPGTRVEDWDPSWSPDGTAILFTRTRLDLNADGKPGSSTPADVYVVRPDGTGLRRLIRDASVPSWSPDGRSLVFARPGGGLWIARADGTGARRLSARSVLPRTFWLDRRRLFAPEWRPDGGAVAFQSFVGSGGRWELFVVGADGRGERNVTRSGSDDRSPSWSRDGHAIAYSRTQRGTKQIHRVDAGGANPRQLTEGGRGGWHDDCPTWSP